jgi:hypothetical protein
MKANPTISKSVSRRRVIRRLGGVFLIGWLLSFLMCGFESPGRALTSPVLSVLFGVRSLNVDCDMALVCFGVAILAVASIVFSISRSKLLWLSYLALALYWLWTFSLLAIPF